MMHTYGMLWPDHSFVFRVPYQTYPIELKEKYGARIELVQSKKDIVPTLHTLLEGIDDEEWIYWCIDDRYPIFLDTEALSGISRWIATANIPDVAGIGFTYNGRDWSSANISQKEYAIKDDKRRIYYRLTNYKVIWFHQFMRAKVLRGLAKNFPEGIRNAKEMDGYKDEAVLPETYKRYLLKKRLAAFGESSNRGMLTRNCLESMQKLKISIPDDFEILNREIYKGDKARERSGANRFLHKVYSKFKSW